jgi:hypothetical protein
MSQYRISIVEALCVVETFTAKTYDEAQGLVEKWFKDNQSVVTADTEYYIEEV